MAIIYLVKHYKIPSITLDNLNINFGDESILFVINIDSKTINFYIVL